MNTQTAMIFPLETMDTLPGDDSEARLSLRARMVGMIERGEVQQSLAARQAGISAAALSTWLRGEYKGDNGEVERKLARWLASSERRQEAISAAPSVPEWAPTPTAKKIMNALHFAQEAGDLAVIYGGAGLGKTCTCEEYQRRNPNVWIATMAPDTARIYAALEEIAEAANLRSIPVRASRLRRELVKRFQGTGGLLIIDEAQHLSVDALESIRAIHDATGVGLVLSGNEKVYTALFGGSRAATFAQLYSRVGKKVHVTKTSANDAAAYLAAAGLQDKKLCAALVGIATKDRNLRGMVKVYRLAGMMARAAGEPLQEKHVKDAWNETGGSQ